MSEEELLGLLRRVVQQLVAEGSGGSNSESGMRATRSNSRQSLASLRATMASIPDMRDSALVVGPLPSEDIIKEFFKAIDCGHSITVETDTVPKEEEKKGGALLVTACHPDLTAYSYNWWQSNHSSSSTPTFTFDELKALLWPQNPEDVRQQRLNETLYTYRVDDESRVVSIKPKGSRSEEIVMGTIRSVSFPVNTSTARLGGWMC